MYIIPKIIADKLVADKKAERLAAVERDKEQSRQQQETLDRQQYEKLKGKLGL